MEDRVSNKILVDKWKSFDSKQGWKCEGKIWQVLEWLQRGLGI